MRRPHGGLDVVAASRTIESEEDGRRQHPRRTVELYDLRRSGRTARGGYLGYVMGRRYLKFAQGYTAAHPDGIVSYTAHELRHVCASLLIASGASDIQVAHQMGRSRIETTKNIYGHLFAQDRTSILDAMNQAVSRLYAYESQEPGADADANAVA